MFGSPYAQAGRAALGPVLPLPFAGELAFWAALPRSAGAAVRSPIRGRLGAAADDTSPSLGTPVPVPPAPPLPRVSGGRGLLIQLRYPARRELGVLGSLFSALKRGLRSRKLKPSWLKPSTLYCTTLHWPKNFLGAWVKAPQTPHMCFPRVQHVSANSLCLLKQYEDALGGAPYEECIAPDWSTFPGIDPLVASVEWGHSMDDDTWANIPSGQPEFKVNVSEWVLNSTSASYLLNDRDYDSHTPLLIEVHANGPRR